MHALSRVQCSLMEFSPHKVVQDTQAAVPVLCTPGFMQFLTTWIIMFNMNF